MLKENKIIKTGLSAPTNIKYPEIGCITLLESENKKSKMLSINPKGSHMIGLDDGLRIAIVRGYGEDPNALVVGATNIEKIKKSLGGSYKTCVVASNGKFRSNAMYNLCESMFYKNPDYPRELFLLEEVDEGVYSLFIAPPVISREDHNIKIKDSQDNPVDPNDSNEEPEGETFEEALADLRQSSEEMSKLYPY